MVLWVVSIIVALVLAAVVVFGFFWTPSASGSSSSAGSSLVMQIKGMVWAEIDRMLEAIKWPFAPKRDDFVTCYEMAAPPARAEYVCPVCGEKTLYIEEKAEFVERDLTACRRKLEELRELWGLEMTLEEGSFCKHCHPGEETPALVLKITCPDGGVEEIKNAVEVDMYILGDLLSELSDPKDSARLRSLLRKELPRRKNPFGDLLSELSAPKDSARLRSLLLEELPRRKNSADNNEEANEEAGETDKGEAAK